ncbi:MAG TPA: HEPN domain-containing protein [Stellaceae bacterium]|nr:HEPN domain-containing protein [Stellaceae bacterium]
MTPETADYLDKAREFLAKAHDMLADDWPDEAARAAYLAGFHAAQAFTFARTGRVAKSHAGLRIATLPWAGRGAIGRRPQRVPSADRLTSAGPADCASLVRPTRYALTATRLARQLYPCPGALSVIYIVRLSEGTAAPTISRRNR